MVETSASARDSIPPLQAVPPELLRIYPLSDLACYTTEQPRADRARLSAATTNSHSCEASMLACPSFIHAFMYLLRLNTNTSSSLIKSVSSGVPSLSRARNSPHPAFRFKSIPIPDLYVPPVFQILRTARMPLFSCAASADDRSSVFSNSFQSTVGQTCEDKDTSHTTQAFGRVPTFLRRHFVSSPAWGQYLTRGYGTLTLLYACHAGRFTHAVEYALSTPHGNAMASSFSPPQPCTRGRCRKKRR